MKNPNSRIVDQIVESFRGSKSMVVNTKNMKKITTVLKDTEGEEVQINAFVAQISKWSKSKMDDDQSAMSLQIYPFLCSTMPEFLVRCWNKEAAALVLTNPFLRDLIASSALHGFSLAKALEAKKYKIWSNSEDISKHELEKIRKDMTAHDIAGSMALNGDMAAAFQDFMEKNKGGMPEGFDYDGGSGEDEK